MYGDDFFHRESRQAAKVTSDDGYARRRRPRKSRLKYVIDECHLLTESLRWMISRMREGRRKSDVLFLNGERICRESRARRTDKEIKRMCLTRYYYQ